MNAKVGKDVLKLQTQEQPVRFFYSGQKNYASKVFEVLKQSERPLNVHEIQKLVGIKNWTTAKSVLMDLVLSGKVEVFKTGRYFLFRVKTIKKGRTVNE